MSLGVLCRAVPAFCAALALTLAVAAPNAARAQIVLQSVLTLDDPNISDQDDMCIWVHPTNHALSTIIASDKAANRLFVYDLSGNTLQSISTSGQPGNIDIRYNFMLGGVSTDIVAFNDRTNQRIQVFKVDRTTRQLSRVDNNAIATGANYGFTLYRSMQTGLYYAFATSESGTIKQFRLSDSGGQVVGTQVRSWSVGSITEGCAADDVNGTVFLAQETEGVWKVGAEPNAPTPGSLIATVGDASGLTDDVEGITIYHRAGNDGYLMVSSQGSDEFIVYDLRSPHDHIETFSIDGVTGSDGIDVTNTPLGPSFPFGIFTAHNDSPTDKPVEVCRFEATNLEIDTASWDPRNNLTLDAPGTGGTGPTLGLTSQPNPLRAATQVRYQLPSAQHVELDVLDVAGRRVAMLASGKQDAGLHEVSWSARTARGERLANGLYFVRLRLGAGTLTHKVIVAF
jgi:3-phytase